MGFILVIHVIVCVLLVISILMQAGRGGGLTETFQSAESMFGTQTNVFMVRLTTILAAIFLSTSLISSLVVLRLSNIVTSLRLTTGVGTRTLNPSNLPFKLGTVSATAVAAPVVVGTILWAAARPSRTSLVGVSVSVWLAVSL